MDRKRRLVGFLGTLLLELLLVAVLINLYSLRSEVVAKVAASERLAGVLLETGQIERDLPPAESAIRLAEILNSGSLRHLTIRIDDWPGTGRRLARTVSQLAATRVGNQLQARYARKFAAAR